MLEEALQIELFCVERAPKVVEAVLDCVVVRYQVDEPGMRGGRVSLPCFTRPELRNSLIPDETGSANKFIRTNLSPPIELRNPRLSLLDALPQPIARGATHVAHRLQARHFVVHGRRAAL